MRTSNPALNDRIFSRETGGQDALRPGWAAAGGAATATAPAPDTVSAWTPAYPPATRTDTMTIGGVVSAAAVLLVLLVAAGFFGYAATTATPERIELPAFLIPALLVGFGVAIVTIFKPKYARFTAPAYALIEGFVLGAISRVYEFSFDGIVLQAVGLTVGVFALMLFLYSSRIIKVTDKLRMGIVMATGAVALVYMVTLIARLFGADVGFIHSAGGFGILFSLVVVGIASLNLLLDFDIAERGAAMGAPKYMEWYAAFGLLVTLVWLYLELLRLLAKLRSR